MCANRVRIETLKTLEPVASLPEARLHELVDLCHVETARKNSNPFLVRGIVGQAVYLLRGELVLTYPDGSSKVLVAGSERSRYPLGRRGEVFTSVKAITDVELMRIDDDLLADLKSGDAFGEEALVSEARRNATVTMKTDGALLRLSRKDFAELLREPLLHRLSAEEARDKIARGAQWVDVRYPSEYQYDKLAGAINIPLSEIRNAFGVLDKGKEYVLYCQSGRRSAAAAFLLAQRGYRAFVLSGGLWGETKHGS